MNVAVKEKIVQRVGDAIVKLAQDGKIDAPPWWPSTFVRDVLEAAGYFDVVLAVALHVGSTISAQEARAILDEKLGRRWWFIGNPSVEDEP